MRWTALPRGPFSGVNWAAPGAADGFDPYLVWAEADRFAGYGFRGRRLPRWLPVLLELAPSTTIAQLLALASRSWLRVPGVYGGASAPPGLRFCTARIRPQFFRAIAPGGVLAGHVRRFELGLPAGHHADDPTEPQGRPAPEPPPVRGPVIGLIDGGLAFAHANFLRGGRTRIARFWRQDAAGRGQAPAGLGYGHEVLGEAIDRQMRDNRFGGLVDETRVYRAFDMGLELDKRVNHGTHVLDIAAGPRRVTDAIANLPPDRDAPPSWALAGDAASQCPVLAVQLDWDTIRDTSGGSMNVHILDALMYLRARKMPADPMVVNLSWGTLAGPHDGTSILEAAMDQLIALDAGRLQIVLPVSNAYQQRTHANARLAPGESVDLHWCGLPDDPTQNFVEVWFDSDGRDVSIELTPPGRDPLPPLRGGQSGVWTDGGRQPLAALIYPRRVATGTRGTCALLAVAPTASFEPGVTLAPSGDWRIRLHNHGSAAVILDAYIERDDEIIGVRTGARQSHFTDMRYEQSQWDAPLAFTDDPANPTPIRRSGTFNSIATGSRTLSVGGTRLSDGGWAHYSPRRPDPDVARPQRPGVVKMPDTSAASDETRALPGLKAAASRSGGVARLVGTSDAAPQLTRARLNRVAGRR